MILRLFRRALREHFGFHLLIPLVLIFLISLVKDPSILRDRPASGLEFFSHWLVSHAWQLAEVYLAFFLVVAWSIKLASDLQSTRVETVRDLLPDAKRYFAIGIIPVREWFEPDTAVYLATVIHHQTTHADFSHERVLLFMRESDLQAVSVSYLDGQHAKAFAAIHREYEIPLGYLTPEMYVRLMRGLTDRQRRVLKVERVLASWVRSLIPVLPERWTLRPLKPFILLEQRDGTFRAMKFAKHRRTLMLSRIEDEGFVNAATALVNAISQTVYKPGTKTLWDQHNFLSYLQ